MSYARLSTMRSVAVAAFITISNVSIFSANDNVIVQDRLDEYIVKESGGLMSQVKTSETITFLAQRAADRAIAITGYSEYVKIDKATAPGTKPVYLQDDDEDEFYSGNRICALSVDLSPNKPAKANFQRTILKPEQFCTIPLISSYYTKHGSTTVRVPKSLGQSVKVIPMRLTDNMKFSCNESNDEIVYTVEMTDVEAYKKEPYAPSASISAPCLKVSGYFKDVNELYRYLSSRIDQSDATSASVDSLARRITATKVDVKEKIDTIASWVRQNIRYIAVENGDYGIHPEAADVVLHRKYGDCKGSASLIRALLRAVGIDGRYVWLGTRGEIDTDWTDLPALCSGNHMIAAAVVNDSIIYLDGTMRYCPAGYLSPSIRGAQTLVEKNADECIIGRVPELDLSEDTDELLATINITDSSINGHLVRTFKGIMHHIFSSSYYDKKKTRQSDILKTYLAYPKNATTSFSNINLPIVADNSKPGTTIEADFSETASISRTASTLYVSVYPIKEAFLDVLDLKERVRSMRISVPHRYVANITVNIPEGYTADAIPTKKSVKSKWFDCEISYDYSADGKAIVCTAEFKTLDRTANREELEQWNSDFKKFVNANNWRLVFQKQ